MKTKLSAALMLLLTSIVWGFAFVAQVKGSNHVDTFTFNGARFILGGLSFWSAVVFIVNVACALVTFFYVKKRRE